MNGIRVSNIPIQLSERLLRTYFTDLNHGGGEIKRIYYPLINNDAVIIFKNEITAVTAVTKISEENSVSFRVTPLPHQIFSSVDVHLDSGLSTVVLATDEYMKTLQEWGLNISVGLKGRNTCVLSGSWYKIEWAWNYLSQIMEKQHAIHHRLRTQTSMDDSDFSIEISDREISPVPERLTNGTSRVADMQASVSSSQSMRLQNADVSSNDRIHGQTDMVNLPTTVNHGGRGQTQRMSSESDQHYSSLQYDQENVSQELSLSLTSSFDQSMTRDSSSSNSRARDADSTFNHFTSLQTVAHSPRQPVTRSARQEDRSGNTRSPISDHSHDTYRVDTVNYKYSDRKQDDAAADTDESDTETIQDHLSIASGQSDASRNSLRIDKQEQRAISPIRNQQPVTSGNRLEESPLSNSRHDMYAASSAPFQADEEVPDGYKSQSLKIGDLKIKIYLADITKSTAEAIVNAANSELMNFAGVARAISKAAGETMERECENYIHQHGRLNTTCVMHTSSGGQLKQFKYILHTVGPIYLGEKYKDECLSVLTQTFFNCLDYSEEHLYLKSLGLPFISTGVYATPLEDCIAAFIDAILLFMRKYKHSSTLTEIHLVNNDINIVSMASTLLQSTLDGADLHQMSEDAMKRFKMRPSRNDDLYSRNMTASGVFGTRHKDVGSSLRRSNSVEYLNRTDDSHADTSVTRGYDLPDPIDGNAGAGISAVSRKRSGSLTLRNKKSPDKNFTQPRSPILSSSQDLASHSRHSDTGTSHRSSTTGKTFPVTDSSARASNISQSLKKNISQSQTKSPRSSVSPMKALPNDSADSRKSRGVGGTVSRSTARSVDSYTSLPADLNQSSRALRRPSSKTCGICLDEMINPKVLTKCGHTYCQVCIKRAFVSKPVCPECGAIYGVIIGDQPIGGKMIHKIIHEKTLEGFRDTEGILEITYSFNDGTQAANHPNPGMMFRGLRRKAFLPNNKEGREILHMLYNAFDARLIFTIGNSCTTGETDVLTWNDIHHKTSMTGGPTNHGYPDSSYLKRVREELSFKGITK